MASLQEQLEEYAAKYKTLTQREKILVAIVLVLVPAYVIYSLIIEPLIDDNGLAQQQIITQRQTITQNTIRRNLLQFQSTQDPDKVRKRELEDLTKRLDKVNEELTESGNSMVSPAQMNALLSQLVVKSGSNLKMVEIVSEPPVSILAATQKAAENPDEDEDDDAKAKEKAKENDEHAVARARYKSNLGNEEVAPTNDADFDLVKHGVTITLTGHYQELANYIKHLENAPQKLIFGKMEYQVSQYPNAVMRITVYSLSERYTWMEF